MVLLDPPLAHSSPKKVTSDSSEELEPLDLSKGSSKSRNDVSVIKISIDTLRALYPKKKNVGEAFDIMINPETGRPVRVPLLKNVKNPADGKTHKSVKAAATVVSAQVKMLKPNEPIVCLSADQVVMTDSVGNKTSASEGTQKKDGATTNAMCKSQLRLKLSETKKRSHRTTKSAPRSSLSKAK